MKYVLTISLLFAYSTSSYFYKVLSIQPHISNCLKSVDTSRYAIFTLDQTRGYPFDKDYRATTLSAKELEKVDKLIKRAVLLNRKEYGKYGVMHFEKYYKQIVAAINLKGEKEVWVNCVCSIADVTDWKKSLINMLDGGQCYFNLKINLTKGIVYDFMVNGVA